MVNVSIFKLQLVKENSSRYNINKKILSPDDAYNAFLEIFSPECEPEEIFIMITLNTKNVITGAFEVSRGSLNSSIVTPREVFKRALLNNSSSIVICHNHPSGDTTPSQEDINITKRLVESGKVIGIEVLDHIIIGDVKYLSFKDKGLM